MRFIGKTRCAQFARVLYLRVDFLFQIPLWLQPTAFHLSSKITNNCLLAVFFERALIKALCWFQRLLHCPTSLFLYEVYYLFIVWISTFRLSRTTAPSILLICKENTGILLVCLCNFFSGKIDSSSGKEFSAFEPLLNNVNEIYPDLMCEYCCPFSCLGFENKPFYNKRRWSLKWNHFTQSCLFNDILTLSF